ncbi:MAG: polysaccharide pyruvyl transferase CsaB [Defluviitaleaceae bacterium]|nr:polysaccharide pyruvyl transferase CsaB [Defluviitaleaceae bacterium]MCL2239822.1 polysaccharide pyruvyl transferase CsaB [Defluviitaleaceae bacterium]
MKVLHMISGGDKGGAKTAVFALLLALDEKIDITIACFTEGVFYQEVQDLPVESILFKQKFRNDLSIIRRLSRYIRRNGFDIVHAHGARANFISMMLKPFVKVPLITTVHSDYRLDFTDKWYKKFFYTNLNAIALRTMDYFIGVSENFRRMLIERGFDEGRVFSVHNAVEPQRARSFCPKAEFLARFDIDSRGKTLIGIFGRFDYVKGHDIFLRAAGEICAKREDALFLMAGEGFEEGNLRKLARQLGIADKIIFTGFVEDIFSFINAIDINVCASRSESFPYMLHEGALMKKPAVSTDVGGISELIIHGETGTLVPEGDYRKLAEAIMYYMDNPGIGAVHGEKLLAHAEERYSKEKMQEKSIEIYHAVLRKEKRAHRVFDVMLSGYFGHANSGDDALLDAIIKSLRRERADISILALSRNPAETTREYGVFSINRFNLFSVRRYMKRARLMVYGGGSHMQDVTSTRSLVYYTFLVHMAKHMGLRVMLYGNGIGPISKARNIAKARQALEICDYVSLRDPESLRFVQNMGVRNPNIYLSVDPVFSLAVGSGSVPEEIVLDKDRQYYALSLRPWQYNEPGFVDKIADMVNYAAQAYGLVPLLIPMHLMDMAILRETAKRITGEYLLLPRVYRYNEIMAVMAESRFVVGMRLHALIYAAGMGLPIIGLVYDPKVANFIAYVNAVHQVDTSALDLPALKGMVDAIMADPAAREKIAAQSQRLRALSSRDAQVAIALLEGPWATS